MEHKKKLDKQNEVSKIYTLKSGGKIRSCFPDISLARFRSIAILDWGEQGLRSKNMATKKMEALFQPIKVGKEQKYGNKKDRDPVSTYQN